MRRNTAWWGGGGRGFWKSAFTAAPGASQSRIYAGHEGDLLVGIAAWRRKARAVLAKSANRSRLITRVRRAARTWGPLPVRARCGPSPNVTPLKPGVGFFGRRRRHRCRGRFRRRPTPPRSPSECGSTSPSGDRDRECAAKSRPARGKRPGGAGHLGEARGWRHWRGPARTCVSSGCAPFGPVADIDTSWRAGASWPGSTSFGEASART